MLNRSSAIAISTTVLVGAFSDTVSEKRGKSQDSTKKEDVLTETLSSIEGHDIKNGYYESFVMDGSNCITHNCKTCKYWKEKQAYCEFFCSFHDCVF